MNQKTAKLIRKYCFQSGASYRNEKRGWLKAPKTTRLGRRTALREQLL